MLSDEKDVDGYITPQPGRFGGWTVRVVHGDFFDCITGHIVHFKPTPISEPAEVESEHELAEWAIAGCARCEPLFETEVAEREARQ